ncbi:MAG TPA: hypothetical protein VGH35_09480 [Gaiellaceae bacterium]
MIALADADREERLRHTGRARDDADADHEQRELDEQLQIDLGFATPRPDATRIVTTLTAIVRR